MHKMSRATGTSKSDLLTFNATRAPSAYLPDKARRIPIVPFYLSRFWNKCLPFTTRSISTSRIALHCGDSPPKVVLCALVAVPSSPTRNKKRSRANGMLVGDDTDTLREEDMIQVKKFPSVAHGATRKTVTRCGTSRSDKKTRAKTREKQRGEARRVDATRR